MQAKEYRADIDVLRAIAVLAVIFYHSHIPFFSGGYVGVSIFFVISGYLITGIIKRRLENNSFSFVEFYENRVRRIFPALFFMVFCLVLFEWFTSVNVLERRELYGAAKRVLLTVPNIYFYLHTNYFAPAAETIPLLHTWSLGVEEQFYFIFPLLLCIFYSYLFRLNKRKTVYLLSFLFACSFLFSAVYVFYNQKFTFYMLPTRAWELLCGGILAYTEWTPKTQKNKIRCFLLGTALMVFAIVRYTDNIYPGFYALFPCFGAVLYIAGGTGLQSRFADLLIKNKVLVFIGVISYSLYLWHWPVLVYYQNWLYQREITAESACLLLAVIFLLSAFSWRFIEKPVRQKPVFKKHAVLWTGVACSFGIMLLFINNLKFTLSSDEGYHFTHSELPAEYVANNADKTLLLLGDSHSFHLRPLAFALGEKYSISCYNANMPMPYRTYNAGKTKNEIKSYEQTYQSVADKIKTRQFDTAVIAYRYSWHIDGIEIKRKNAILYPLKSLDEKSDDPYQALYRSLKDIILLLQENGVKKIYLVNSLPQANSSVPQSANKLSFLFKLTPEKINAALGETTEEYQERTGKIYPLLQALTEEFPGVYFLDPAPYFLNDQKTGYDVIRGKTALYWDDDHLSDEGAMLLAPLYEPIFQSMQ